MISCRQARHLFDAFLDDELSPGLRAELHTHRVNCPACSQELAILEACADVIATDRREPRLHPDFADRVMVAFAGRRPAATYRWRRIVLFVGSPFAAAAVLLFALTTWFHAASPRANRGMVASYTQGVSPAMAEDLSNRTGRALSQADLEGINKANTLPDRVVLDFLMLRRMIDKANNTLDQTRRSASQFVNLAAAMFPAEVSVAVSESRQPPTRQEPAPAFLPSESVIDIEPFDAEHGEQPESTSAEVPLVVM